MIEYKWKELKDKRLLLTDRITRIKRSEWTLLEISPNSKVGKFRNELADTRFWTDLDDLVVMDVLPDKQYEPTYEGQLDKCQDERHSLQMQLEEYIEAFEFERKEFHEALDDLAKMKAERDEARREVCNLQPYAQHNDGIAKDHAAYRGWDCFKENTNG